MKMTGLRLLRLAVMLCCLPTLHGFATTYYISSLHGSAGNNGLSTATPWVDFTQANSTTFQPGDRILLERGSVWNATLLSPLGSGTAAAPIVIDSYGPKAARPVINAAGVQSTLNGAGSAVVNDATYYPNFKYGSGAVTLFNQQYWEINNLELTNTVSGTFNVADKANNFSGIRVWARAAGPLSHIYIRGNYIHNVTGEVSWSGDRAESKRTGGIVVYTWDYNSEAAHTTFDDVRIENNFIQNVSMEGICVQQASKTNLYASRTSYADTSSFTPYTNVIVDGNVINNQTNANSSDGIQFIGVQHAHAYNNLVLGGGTVGIEVDLSDQATLEGNEVAGVHQHYINGGGIDHAGIDIDAQTSNIVTQYNYAHDNGEGLIMDGFTFGYNNVVRFNLLANNDVGQESTSGNTIPGDQMRVAEENGSSYIYNNTLYDKNQTLNIVGYNQPTLSGDVATYFIQNNIFDGGVGAWPGGSSIVNHFSNNSYFRNGTAPSGDAHPVISDPQLLNAGGTDYGTTPGAFPLSAYGYRIGYNSPAKGAGTTPTLPAGSPAVAPLSKDFFHNNVGSPPNIGFDTSGGGLPSHITVPVAAWLWNTNSGADANGSAWQADSTYAGASGLTAEAALPDAGYNDAPGTGPVLGYRVLFPGAATYNAFVRGVAADQNADSMHLGLDGSYPSTGTNVFWSTDTTEYRWTGEYYNTSSSAGSPATLAVAGAGAHYVDVNMREDGLRVDSLVLSSDPNYVPTIWAGDFDPSTSTVSPGVDPSGHAWVPDTTYAGYFNTGAMLCAPATAAEGQTASANAVLNYAVTLPAAGTWYVWVHAYSAGAATSSVAVAFENGAATPVLLGATGSYVWANTSDGSTPVSVSTTTAGVHTLRVFAMQAGIRVDKFFLTLDANSFPRSN